jgi:ParB family transcriptional regulator, chromosome partitioning protein
LKCTIGQIQAITVRVCDESGKYILVAGAHRLEAAKLLGWHEITATIRIMDAVEAAIIEIDENLIRNELSAIDQALSLAERKGLWEQKYPEAAHGKSKKSKQNQLDGKVANIATLPSRFTKEAAKATGLSERSIQYACKLAADLSPELIALLRSSSIADNAAQLRLFVEKTMIEEDKLLAAQAIAEGKAKNFRAALDVIGRGEPAVPQDCFKKLMYFWMKATKRERLDFEDFIGVNSGSQTASHAA